MQAEEPARDAPPPKKIRDLDYGDVLFQIGANSAQSPRGVTDALGMTEWFDYGGLQKLLLLGSTEVGEEALIRFYLLHVMILPLVLVALLAVHFLACAQGWRPCQARGCRS